jgi:ribosomal protein S18 acetylase RimI-like enzyme
VKNLKTVYFGEYRICKEYYGKTNVEYWLFQRYGKTSIGHVDINTGQVEDLWIRNEWKRKGLATKLMRELVLDWGHIDMTLIVEDEGDMSSKDLRKFYRKFGFKSDRLHKNFMRRKATA